MTKLECNVTNCLHNSDHCCCKQSIMVDGHDAKEKEQTCCGSFDNRHCAAAKIGIAGDGARRAEQTLCTTFQMP